MSKDVDALRKTFQARNEIRRLEFNTHRTHRRQEKWRKITANNPLKIDGGTRTSKRKQRRDMAHKERESYVIF